MNHKFTTEEKKIVADQIAKITSKKLYKKLFKIIRSDTNNYSVNNNGVFINLNILSDSTLYKISELLKKYKEKTSSEIDTEPIFSENICFHKDEFKDFEDYSGKLSNHEKNILRKKRLEEKARKKDNIVYSNYLLSSDTEKN